MKAHAVSAVFFAVILVLALAPLTVLAQTASPPSQPPPAADCTYHAIVENETLSAIAARYHVTLADLVALNNLPSAHHIYAGLNLRITCPDSGTGQPSQGSDSTPLTSPVSLSDAPRVTGATSTGCRQVKVLFSETVNDAAANPANYSIVQVGGDANNSRLVITKARFADGAHTVVELTTLAQDEVRYQLTAVAMRDRNGQPLAPRERWRVSWSTPAPQPSRARHLARLT